MRIYFLENMFFLIAFDLSFIAKRSTMLLVWIYICCNPESSFVIGKIPDLFRTSLFWGREGAVSFR